MGRAPCCDKANVKKGPWSPEEDAKLKAYIEEHGTGGNWIALPQKIGLKRCGKSCRLRWLNYLRPNIKHGGFSEEEDNIICSLYINIGSRWSIIAAQLPGRTDNDIKNYWNTRLKKKLLGKQRREQQALRAIIKQEIKREGESLMVQAGALNQQALYSPDQLPVVVPMMNNPTQLDTHFADQELIRNLLIKLGGRCSDDHQQESNTTTTTTNYPLDASCSQDQLYANSINMLLSSSATLNSIDSTCSQLPNNTNYNMFQGLNQGLAVELEELAYGNPQELESLERFYGMDMGNGNGNGNGASSSSAESSSWSNMNFLQAYPQLVSDYETGLESMPPHQDSSVEDSRYFGPL